MSHNEIHPTACTRQDPIRLDDATNPEKYKTLNPNAQYWTDRWANQMNYRYWKERCQAEMTSARRRGAAALLRGHQGLQDAATSARPSNKFREGLAIWDDNLKDYPLYRNDDLNKKDTGLIVKRYVRVLRQLGEPVPEEFPFKELLAAAEADTTLDPFDAIEMLGVGAAEAGGGSQSSAPAAKPAR